MANQTGTKTPKNINDKLVKMVELSIDLDWDNDFWDSLTKKQQSTWKKLCHAIDTTCETIQAHFNK